MWVFFVCVNTVVNGGEGEKKKSVQNKIAIIFRNVRLERAMLSSEAAKRVKACKKALPRLISPSL